MMNDGLVAANTVSCSIVQLFIHSIINITFDRRFGDWCATALERIFTLLCCTYITQTKCHLTFYMQSSAYFSIDTEISGNFFILFFLRFRNEWRFACKMLDDVVCVTIIIQMQFKSIDLSSLSTFGIGH